MPATDWDFDKLLPIVATTKSNPISCAPTAAVVRKKLVQLWNISGLEDWLTRANSPREALHRCM